MPLPLCVRIDNDDERSGDALLADGWRPVEILELWHTNIAYPIIGHYHFDVRRLRYDDREDCHAILRLHKLDRLHMDKTVPEAVADEARRQWFAAALEEHLVLVADAGGVLGFVTAYPWLGEHRIGFVAVRPDMRGRGVAKALIRDVIRRTKTDLYAATQLHNEAARGLYASLGFECVHRQRTFHK